MSTPTVRGEVAKREDNSLSGLITRMKPEIARALPKHMDPDRLARIALTVLRQTPALGRCSPESFLGALMTCAQLGLEPGPLGHAYLVPFRNAKTGTTEVQFIPGYKGLIDLARRSGLVLTVSAHVVRERDQFQYQYGLEEKLQHRPARGDAGQVTEVYAVVRYKDGGHDFEVMTVAEIEAVRARSKAKAAGPWVTDWPEMAKKTVIKRLSKRMPLSVEFVRAVNADEQTRTQLDEDALDLVPEYDEDDVIDSTAEDDDQAPEPAGDGERHDASADAPRPH